MNRAVITVVGSCNMDLVARVTHLPAQGETILGESFSMFPGGKGANQAVGIARLGGEVHFVGCVGEDSFGQTLTENLEADGIDTSHLKHTGAYPSGVAMIVVDDRGENVIVVTPGANHALSVHDVEQAGILKHSDAVVLQLETPLDVVHRSIEIAHEHGATTILNPAPARHLSDVLLKHVDILTPNETEAGILTGVNVTDSGSATKAAQMLLERGAKAVVITMGRAGAMVARSNNAIQIPAHQVHAVDTTAAGDAFTGGLTFGIARGDDIESAARFASVVAALVVTRHGAQGAMPTLAEVEAFMNNHTP